MVTACTVTAGRMARVASPRRAAPRMMRARADLPARRREGPRGTTIAPSGRSYRFRRARHAVTAVHRGPGSRPRRASRARRTGLAAARRFRLMAGRIRCQVAAGACHLLESAAIRRPKAPAARFRRAARTAAQADRAPRRRDPARAAMALAGGGRPPRTETWAWARHLRASRPACPSAASAPPQPPAGRPLPRGRPLQVGCRSRVAR